MTIVIYKSVSSEGFPRRKRAYLRYVLHSMSSVVLCCLNIFGYSEIMHFVSYHVEMNLPGMAVYAQYPIESMMIF